MEDDSKICLYHLIEVCEILNVSVEKVAENNFVSEIRKTNSYYILNVKQLEWYFDRVDVILRHNAMSATEQTGSGICRI